MRTLYRLSLISSFILSTLVMRAQTPAGIIHGTVVDSATNDPLEDATVMLYALPDPGAVLLTSHRSGAHGFIFHIEHAGRYRLIGTYQGYAPDTVETMAGGPGNKDIGLRLTLHPLSKTLSKVIVTALVPPAVVRHDTIVFNAGAFSTRPYSTVEDLLRKLPGVEVDKDGNITILGKKVVKLYLDGKEFFLGDPQLATKNLPADIVDQVEVFDNQSDQSRKTGVKEITQTKAINIKLKKSRRFGYFGNAYAGTGSGAGYHPSSPVSAYSAGGTITSLQSSWSFVSANLNNINNQFTGEENRNGPGSGGNQRLNSLQAGYSNLSDQPVPKRLDYIVGGGTSGNHTVLEQKTTTQTSLTDSSLLSSRNSQSTATSQTTAGNLFLEYQPDSMSVITIHGADGVTGSSNSQSDTTSISTLKPAGAYADNQGRTVNSSNLHSTDFNNEISLLRRTHVPQRNIYVSAGMRNTRQRQSQNTYSLIRNFDSSGRQLSPTLIDQSIRQSSGADRYEVNSTYTEPLRSGNQVNLLYHLVHSISHDDRASNDFDSATGRYDHPDSGTSNHFTTYNTLQDFRVNYNGKTGRLQYQLGAGLEISQLRNLDHGNDATLKNRQTNWLPQVALTYTTLGGSNLFLSYGVSTITPTVQQLQPVSDPTNPFLLKLGNPALLRQLTHSAHFGLNSLNTKNFQSLQLDITGNYCEHYISTATAILSGGIQQVQYINVDGVWNTDATVVYGFPLGDPKKGNSSIGIDGSCGRIVNEINGAGNVTEAFHWGANWKVNLHPVEKIFIEAKAAVSHTSNYYSLNREQNGGIWLQTYSLDASYVLPGAITFSTLYNLQVAGAQAGLPAQSVAVWNAAVYKDLGRRHDFQLRLSAFGLLNTTRTLSQSTGVNYFTTSQTNIPGRILLLSLVYHFKHFPGGVPTK